MKNLISTADLSIPQIRDILTAAHALRPFCEKRKSVPLLQGKTIVNLFFENSTRTRTSFELATRKLGGNTLNFAAATSSTQKGETLVDTAKNIAAMQADCLVVRHGSAGSPAILANSLDLAIVNAGDGFHEHPTQALLDAFTMELKLGSLTGKKVLIVGDIAHSRVARSNIYLLKKMGAEVFVCGPPTLLPPHVETLGVKYSYHLNEFLPHVDVVMALRIQKERQNQMQVPSLSEYARFWGLRAHHIPQLKKGAIIMHPGPVNRGVEVDSAIADGPQSVILDQVFNGIVVRMAVLSYLCNPTGLSDWLSKEGSHV